MNGQQPDGKDGPLPEAEAPNNQDPAAAVQGDDALAAAEAQAAEYLSGWQRARAELDNYRKRTERERAQWRASIRGEVIEPLLPILDDFTRAVESRPDGLADDEWANGVELIYRKLQNTLEAMGVTEIEALGEPFDPNRMEAAMQRNVPDAEPETVVEVLRKGYEIEGRVLRPPMVVVAQ